MVTKEDIKNVNYLFSDSNLVVTEVKEDKRGGLIAVVEVFHPTWTVIEAGA